MEPDAQQAPPIIPMLQSLFRGQLMILTTALEVVPPSPIPTRTKPTPAESQPPVVDLPASPEVEILSPPPAPPAPPLILIPDDSDAKAAAPPDSPAYYLEDGSDFSDWMDN
ncbi:hypothetical protein HKD37_15G043416 [Glycine soja]